MCLHRNHGDLFPVKWETHKSRNQFRADERRRGRKRQDQIKIQKYSGASSFASIDEALIGRLFHRRSAVPFITSSNAQCAHTLDVMNALDVDELIWCNVRLKQRNEQTSTPNTCMALDVFALIDRVDAITYLIRFDSIRFDLIRYDCWTVIRALLDSHINWIELRFRCK